MTDHLIRLSDALAAIPGGDHCDPQAVADALRALPAVTMSTNTPAELAAPRWPFRVEYVQPHGYVVWRDVFEGQMRCNLRDAVLAHRQATFVCEQDAADYCEYRNDATIRHGTDDVELIRAARKTAALAQPAQAAGTPAGQAETIAHVMDLVERMCDAWAQGDASDVGRATEAVEEAVTALAATPQPSQPADSGQAEKTQETGDGRHDEEGSCSHGSVHVRGSWAHRTDGVATSLTDSLWNNTALMELNAELGLTMNQLVRLARALASTPQAAQPADVGSDSTPPAAPVEHDAQRACFEKFFSWSRTGRGAQHREKQLLRKGDGTYCDDHTQRHWWTWQQAVASAAPQGGQEASAPQPSAVKVPEGWISVEERLPEPDTGEVLVWLIGGRCAFDEWHMYREDPTGMGGPTMEMGLMWRDYDYDEITHWQPLPAAPSAQGETS